MIAIPSVDIILGLIKKTRDLSKGYFTNFFLDVPKTQLWIQLDLISYVEIGETIIICKKNNGFNNLFFLATSESSLQGDLTLFLNRYPEDLFLIDIVGFGNNILKIENLLVQIGFKQYTSLVRMSKITPADFPETKNYENLSYADRQKGPEVYRLLQAYFDPYAEQLPLMEEINSWIDKYGIFVYSDDNQTVQGFLIFDLIGQTSYLRYWFVHPDHREKKIGSALLRRFFGESKNTKRQLFWVIGSNDNAIKRYEHYGFLKEDLYDYVMINRNLRYEG
jgi:ribosomal protein S18 acetylase RimI-like enzyme